jgi:microcystin-dependent protein
MAGDGNTLHYGWVLPADHASTDTWGGPKINANFVGIDDKLWTVSTEVTAIQGYLTPTSLTISRQGTAGGELWFNNADAAADQQHRWIIYEDAGAEGSNANSNLTIQAYDDTGVYLGWAMQFVRSTQRVQLAKSPVGGSDIAIKSYVDAGAAPVGSIVMWPGPHLPAGWTWCLGYHLKYTDYPALFNVIGGTFFWDGTNFGIPNLAGRTVLGYDGSGWSLNRQDGEYYHVLAASELPTGAYADSGHSHSVYDPQHRHDSGWLLSGQTGVGPFSPNNPQPGNAGDMTGYAATGVSIYAAAAAIYGGGNAGHLNMQPSVVLGYIIRCL